ncbi:alpha/beta hydrolase [Neobacillus cucumis]|uniref:Alpha/beta hydrolase n=1 Tax=Neobacillus cucumis TaxID=1740721 RepID=A0A2N5HBI6_9BACI|nr:alpha/beta hydrolase [Neobacillus cucumis]PLS02875.1 alpha/beta hydrolase [Neobacillus cucumis]
MTEILPLWEDIKLEENGPNQNAPSIQPFLLEGPGPFPVMIVAAGGAYARRAEHEAYPVAEWLNSIGVSAVVLNYRVAPYKHPVPLNDAKRAIRLVRHRAADWNIDPNRVGILGFSAGGHLASSAGTHYDFGSPETAEPIERYSSRPDVIVLCYPVISMGKYTHEGSRLNLLGENPTQELLNELSNDNQITELTPPAFIWHTADDASVPVENSLMFAAGLGRHKVPFDLHIFESGRHGLGLAEEHPEAREWTRLCEKWLRKQNF